MGRVQRYERYWHHRQKQSRHFIQMAGLLYELGRLFVQFSPAQLGIPSSDPCIAYIVS